MNKPVYMKSVQPGEIWLALKQEVARQLSDEPLLASFLKTGVLDHDHLSAALCAVLSNKLKCEVLPFGKLRAIIQQALDDAPLITDSAEHDLLAFRERDPACDRLSLPFLYYKGYQGLQLYRIGHWLWKNNKKELALYLQSQVSNAFGIDIHPAAVIGKGILIDHANSLVIGETAVVGDNVSMLHEVTLGGTGKDTGDRHPKVKSGVLIGAGAKILGNVTIGEGAKIGAGSVVLSDVPSHCTVAGVPAKVVGGCSSGQPAFEMDHTLEN